MNERNLAKLKSMFCVLKNFVITTWQLTVDSCKYLTTCFLSETCHYSHNIVILNIIFRLVLICYPVYIGF